MFEIYNEQLQDVLSTESAKIVVMGDPGTHIRVSGLSEHSFNSYEEGVELVNKGAASRVTASTKMNDRSSRSHLITLLRLTCRDLVARTHWSSKLYLVDLAGSEDVAKSGATGSTLREAANINKSLSALHDVMGQLASRSGHVPFRNSKLTHVLSDSLGGQAKTLMYVMVSPSSLQVRETTAALNFAARCKTVVLGPAMQQAREKDGAGKAAGGADPQEVLMLRSELERAQEEADRSDNELKTLRKTTGLFDRFQQGLTSLLYPTPLSHAEIEAGTHKERRFHCEELVVKLGDVLGTDVSDVVKRVKSKHHARSATQPVASNGGLQPLSHGSSSGLSSNGLSPTSASLGLPPGFPAVLDATSNGVGGDRSPAPRARSPGPSSLAAVKPGGLGAINTRGGSKSYSSDRASGSIGGSERAESIASVLRQARNQM